MTRPTAPDGWRRAEQELRGQLTGGLYMHRSQGWQEWCWETDRESGAKTYKTPGTQGSVDNHNPERWGAGSRMWWHEMQSLLFFLWRGRHGVQTAMKIHGDGKCMWEEQTSNDRAARKAVSSRKSQGNSVDLAMADYCVSSVWRPFHELAWCHH